jgi:predicted polyphosphate/ATP-dependent NAD kinase
MLRKLIFLINPIAGTRNKCASLEMIRRQTTRRGFKHEVLDTNATGEYGYLPRKIEADQVTDVVVCGGDGTINAVASALFGTNVNIGVLPMGFGQWPREFGRHPETNRESAGYHLRRNSLVYQWFFYKHPVLVYALRHRL